MKVTVVLSNGAEYVYSNVVDLEESDFEVSFNCDEGKVRVMFNNLSILIIE